MMNPTKSPSTGASAALETQPAVDPVALATLRGAIQILRQWAEAGPSVENLIESTQHG